MSINSKVPTTDCGHKLLLCEYLSVAFIIVCHVNFDIV